MTSPRPRLLCLGTSVTVAGRNVEIVRRAGTNKRPIVRLDGVEDREGADALRGVVLTVAAPEAPALAEGEWWGHELEGCAVIDGEWLIGTVSRMVELPSCEALEVRRETIGSQSTGSHPPAPLIVPMVKDAIRHMGVAEGRIEVDMGFLGEDAPAERGPDSAGRGQQAAEHAQEAAERGLDSAERGQQAAEHAQEAAERDLDSTGRGLDTGESSTGSREREDR